MNPKIYSKTIITITMVIVMNLVFLTTWSQNAVISTPLGIGKECGSNKDSFRLMTYNDPLNQLTVSYKCKPNLGGGTPNGPAFSSSSGSIAFSPKDQKVYYIATTSGTQSFVYSWVPNACPSTKQAFDYYYPTEFVVGLDFDPNSAAGDGYQLEFVGSAAPYTCWLRKVNFATNTFGTSVQITLPAGKKIYQQRGDIIFTPQGQLYFAFDDKLFNVNFSNYGSGSVTATYIDTLVFPSGYHLTGISYVNGKFIGSTQNSTSGCAFKEIDISTGSAVINNITLTNGAYTAVDMATLINGIGVAKKIYSVTALGSYQWSVQYDIKVKNFGNSILNNVQVVENLSAVFGGIVSNVSAAAVGTLPSGLTLNPSFNGTSNTNLFVGGASSILNAAPSDSATIRVTFNLNNPNTTSTYYSSSIGSASDKLFGTSISDSSNNDPTLRADLNANGVPDDANEDIPTPLRLMDWVLLPNNLLDFNGNYSESMVKLHWAMTNTENGLTVNIQRSGDGKNFQNMAILPVKGTPSQQTYAWTDNTPLSNDNFYRLEFVRPNGSTFYSETLTISLKNIKPKELVLSPNPFTDNIYFSINLERPQKVQYKLLSMDSKIVASGEKSGEAGNNKFSIDNLSNVPAGIYLLQTTIGHETLSKVILKHN